MSICVRLFIVVTIATFPCTHLTTHLDGSLKLLSLLKVKVIYPILVETIVPLF